jgi:hypothetical protein
MSASLSNSDILNQCRRLSNLGNVRDNCYELSKSLESVTMLYFIALSICILCTGLAQACLKLELAWKIQGFGHFHRSAKWLSCAGIMSRHNWRIETHVSLQPTWICLPDDLKLVHLSVSQRKRDMCANDEWELSSLFARKRVVP